MPLRPLLSSNAPSLVLDVDHSSAATEGRRAAAQIAAFVGLGETMAGRASIVVNELCTNLLKHARNGTLFIHGSGSDLDLLAVDRGPGMADVGLSLRDGYSSMGTSGTGLGAVRRLSTEFDIHSLPGRGTAVFARLSANGAAAGNSAAMRAGAFWRPLSLDDLCGDACAVFDSGEQIVCVVADGLGHGVAAADASRAAVAVASQATNLEPTRLLERMHAALKPTRGAAVAVAVIHPRERMLRFAGAGNIAASIKQDALSKNLVSVSGIVGHQVRALQEFRYDWAAGSTLIMHSDGLTSRWSFDQQPGLAARHPAIVAAVLARDFGRERDDRCALVVREERR